jgi:hypothetical protein
MTGALSEVVAGFRRWLYLPDPDALLAVLGAVAANRLPGDPVWLMLVAPPGWGKTELIAPLGALPDVFPVATLTEAALLSGTTHKDAKGGTGGLLREIGDRGMILCKDFTSVLSMHREKRAEVLSALREIYDGSWTRKVGVDGGRTLSWSGKCGAIAAVTPVIDTHHAVLGAMGERFAMYRLPAVEPETTAERALWGAGREDQQRAELSDLVCRLFDELPDDPPAFELSAAERARLVALATMAVQARSAVVREGHTREIELVPGAEAPTRMVKMLARQMIGVQAIGGGRDDAWRIATRMALDSIPATRRKLLDGLRTRDDGGTPELAAAVGLPTTTARRSLEELAVYGMVSRESGGNGKSDRWSLTEHARDLLDRSVPEMSGGGERESVPEMSDDPPTYTPKPQDDISGTVPSSAAEPHSNGSEPGALDADLARWRALSGGGQANP